MRLSSFFGCFTLSTGVIIIGILHMISAVVFVAIDVPTFDRHLWIPFKYLLTPFSVILLLGVASRNGDNVFPFLSLQYALTIFLIYDTVIQLQKDFVLVYGFEHDVIYLCCRITAISLMLYFSMVLYSFYEELMREKYTSSLSIDNSISRNGALRRDNVSNNSEDQKSIDKNFEKQMNIQCYTVPVHNIKSTI